MKTSLINPADDASHRQLIWELYGDLLEFYKEVSFSAKQVAYDLNMDTKQVNKILHRLIQKKAVLCIEEDHWGVKTYRLCDAFYS